jgi:4-amino-4-deoxy-L-arabinose transferase-like glycosyltransferase
MPGRTLPRLAPPASTTVVTVAVCGTVAIGLATMAARGRAGLAPGAGVGVTLAWSVFLVSAAWRRIQARTPGIAEAWSPPLARVLAASTLLFVVGIWWGWPGGLWAPDELDPAAVLRGISAEFSRGWYDLYPPLHYYILSLLYAPAVVALRQGWLPADDMAVMAALHLIARALTVAMALGTLVAIAALARRVQGERFAWPAALVAGVCLPFAYYAKTANVDVPYLFWFVLSLLWLREAFEHGRTRDLVGFGVTAALATATKDQAYALYVGPALVLAWRVRQRGWPARGLLLGALASVTTLALSHNVAFNLEGFLTHVVAITTGGSETYRMVTANAAGQVALARLTAAQFGWALGLPGLVLVGVGIVGMTRTRRPPVWLVASALSYYVTFIAVVGYVYDRFLLPVVPLLALLGAVGLRRLLDGWPGARAGRVLAVVLVGGMVWRAASVDLLLVDDARYAAEAWLRVAVRPGQVVAASTRPGYMPRFSGLDYREVFPTPDATLAAAPDYIVVNVEFTNRFPDASAPHRWLGWLESGASPYEEVFRYKARLGWTALAWWPAFADRREDPYTNLDKANPEIVIFRRRD